MCSEECRHVPGLKSGRYRLARSQGIPDYRMANQASSADQDWKGMAESQSQIRNDQEATAAP